jgi:DNA-binding NtrC family response regulator
VDDRPEVLRGLRRYLGLHFDHVHIAATPTEAEVLLETHACPVLLCDYWLGEEVPPATSLIPRWRSRFACLQRVALMTGTSGATLLGSDGIDAVFRKPLDLESLVAFLASPLSR